MEFGQTCPRLFPPLEGAVGTAEWIVANQRIFPEGTALVQLSEAVVPSWKKLTGWGFTSSERVGGFFRVLRCAFQEEAAGQFRRADFYWSLLHKQFKKLKGMSTWPEIDKSIRGFPGHEVEPLQRRVAIEIILDSHLVAYEGWRANPNLQPSSARMNVHIAYLLSIMPELSLAAVDQEHALGTRLLERVSAAIAKEDWEPMERFGKSLLGSFPNRFPYRKTVAEGYFKQCFAKIGNAAKRYVRNASQLSKTIAKIEGLRKEAPHERELLDIVAELCRVRAIQLANADNLAAALESNERAAAHNPFRDDIDELREQLSKAMRTRQAMVDKAVASLGYNQRLNAQGQALYADAKKGFSLAERFVKSDEADQIRQDAIAARARWLWRWIGLGPLPPSDELAMRVQVALNEVFEGVQHNPKRAEQLWSGEVAKHAELAAVDAATVVKFLRARAANEEIPFPQYETGLTSLSASASMKIKESASQSQRMEPLGLWVFSSEARGLKLLLGFVVVCLVILGVLSIRDDSIRSIRDRSYVDLRAAMLKGDYGRAMDQAAAFLGVRTLLDDSRETEVRQTYSEALVRWFNEQPTAPTATDSRLAEYRRLRSK